MYCSFCGGEIPEDSRFCPLCGKALPPDTGEADAAPQLTSALEDDLDDTRTISPAADEDTSALDEVKKDLRGFDDVPEETLPSEAFRLPTFEREEEPSVVPDISFVKEAFANDEALADEAEHTAVPDISFVEDAFAIDDALSGVDDEDDAAAVPDVSFVKEAFEAEDAMSQLDVLEEDDIPLPEGISLPEDIPDDPFPLLDLDEDADIPLLEDAPALPDASGDADVPLPEDAPALPDFEAEADRYLSLPEDIPDDPLPPPDSDGEAEAHPDDSLPRSDFDEEADDSDNTQSFIPVTEGALSSAQDLEIPLFEPDEEFHDPFAHLYSDFEPTSAPQQAKEAVHQDEEYESDYEEDEEAFVPSRPKRRWPKVLLGLLLALALLGGGGAAAWLRWFQPVPVTGCDSANAVVRAYLSAAQAGDYDTAETLFTPGTDVRLALSAEKDPATPQEVVSAASGFSGDFGRAIAEQTIGTPSFMEITQGDYQVLTDNLEHYGDLTVKELLAVLVTVTYTDGSTAEMHFDLIATDLGYFAVDVW